MSGRQTYELVWRFEWDGPEPPDRNCFHIEYAWPPRSRVNASFGWTMGEDGLRPKRPSLGRVWLRRIRPSSAGGTA